MKLIILMYHAVIKDGEKAKDFYQISKEQFTKQIDYIKNSNYKVISIEEINGNINNHNSSAPLVMITFDDGHISSFELTQPILGKYGMVGHFFITVGKIGNNGTMSWEQIRYLRDKKQIIGSHGMTHRILTKLSDGEVEKELRDSKRILEDSLGIPIKYLSIPRGFYNAKIIQKAKEIGYEAIFTSNVGINTPSNLDLFRLNRMPIKRSLSIDRFMRILNGKYMIKEKVEDVFKKTTQNLLGVKNYEKITLRAYK